jgi:hypothetical protein
MRMTLVCEMHGAARNMCKLQVKNKEEKRNKNINSAL